MLTITFVLNAFQKELMTLIHLLLLFHRFFVLLNVQSARYEKNDLSH